jgi:hypothetical protein
MFPEATLVKYMIEVRGAGYVPPTASCANGPTQKAEDPDGPAAQWRWLRRRLYHPPARRGPTVTQLCQAYEARTGTFIGCD